MEKGKAAEHLLKRSLAAVIDSFLLGTVLFLTVFGFVQLFGLTGAEYQGISFVGILAILMPMDILVRIVTDPAPVSAAMPFYFLMLVLFLAEWGTLCIQEMVFSGRTVGKLCMGLWVVCRDGTPVRISNIIVRNLVKVLSRYALLVPMVTVFFTGKHQALHDLIGKSYVVELT